MARPVKRRRVQSLHRDIETIGRLRMALILDASLDRQMVRDAVRHIDGLVSVLSDIATVVPVAEESKTRVA